MKRFMGDPDEDADMLRERSPMTYIENVTTPLLVIQGAKDPRVVKAESDQLVDTLRTLGREVEIVTSGAPLARQVEHVLGARGLGNPAGGEGDYRFLSTGAVDAFGALGTRFLQMPLGPVEHVDLRTLAAAA